MAKKPEKELKPAFPRMAEAADTMLRPGAPEKPELSNTDLVKRKKRKRK